MSLTYTNPFGGAGPAALYPEKLILEILRGTPDTAADEAHQQEASHLFNACGRVHIG